MDRLIPIIQEGKFYLLYVQKKMSLASLHAPSFQILLEVFVVKNDTKRIWKRQLVFHWKLLQYLEPNSALQEQHTALLDQSL